MTRVNITHEIDNIMNRKYLPLQQNVPELLSLLLSGPSELCKMFTHLYETLSLRIKSVFLTIFDNRATKMH